MILALVHISHSGLSLSAYFLNSLSLNFIPVISFSLCAEMSMFSFPCPVRSCSSLSMLTLLDDARLHTSSRLSDKSTLKFVDSLDVTASDAVSSIH